MDRIFRSKIKVNAFRYGIDTMPDWFMDKASSGLMTFFNHHETDHTKWYTIYNKGLVGVRFNYGDWIIKGDECLIIMKDKEFWDKYEDITLTEQEKPVLDSSDLHITLAPNPHDDSAAGLHYNVSDINTNFLPDSITLTKYLNLLPYTPNVTPLVPELIKYNINIPDEESYTKEGLQGMFDFLLKEIKELRLKIENIENKSNKIGSCKLKNSEK